MEPNIYNGELWLARAGIRSIEPGKVVVFEHPNRPDLSQVKRVRWATAEGWWVEGDNTAQSTDSREYGPISNLLIHGVLIRRLSR